MHPLDAHQQPDSDRNFSKERYSKKLVDDERDSICPRGDKHQSKIIQILANEMVVNLEEEGAVNFVLLSSINASQVFRATGSFFFKKHLKHFW